MATKPEIYEFIAQRCRRLRLPAPFDRLHNRLMLRTACRDPQAFLSGLQAQFSVEDLSAAGALIEGGLHPGLARPRALVLPLYEGPGQPPFDLVVGGRMLGRPSSLPARLVLRDFRIAKWFARNRDLPLCMVSSMLDLAILLALGVPAAPVRGLSTMTGAAAQRFWKQLQYSSSREGDSSVGLMLVDWSPARLNGAARPTMKSVRRHFHGLHHFLGVDMSYTHSWTPPPIVLDDLKFSLRFGGRTAAQRAVLHSVILDVTAVIPDPPAPAKPSYVEAMADFMRCSIHPSVRASVDQRLAPHLDNGIVKRFHVLQAAYDRDVLAKALQAAAAEKNPARAATMRAHALECRMRDLSLARLAVHQGYKGPKFFMIDEDGLQQALALSNNCLKHAKELL